MNQALAQVSWCCRLLICGSKHSSRSQAKSLSTLWLLFNHIGLSRCTVLKLTENFQRIGLSQLIVSKLPHMSCFSYKALLPSIRRQCEPHSRQVAQRFGLGTLFTDGSSMKLMLSLRRIVPIRMQLSMTDFSNKIFNSS